MATVHFARQGGAVGFSRVVAIKQLHRRFAKDPDVFAMLVDEARLVGRIQHPNVLPTLDVVRTDKELFLVMEYVHGESLQRLLRALSERQATMPLPVVIGIVSSMLYGLHAAHEAKNERGERLDIVHRDVSPQNVLVGADGVTRVLDFGIAKAQERLQKSTVSGQVKGKLPYMSPEQLSGKPVDRRSDIWSVAVVLWEALTCRRLFPGSDIVKTIMRIESRDIPRPSELTGQGHPELDDIVMRGLATDPEDRFATARDMAHALEAVCPPASPREVGELVEEIAGESLRARRSTIEDLELACAEDTAAGVDAELPARSSSRRVWMAGLGLGLGIIVGIALLPRLMASSPQGDPTPAATGAPIAEPESSPPPTDSTEVVAPPPTASAVPVASAPASSASSVPPAATAPRGTATAPPATASPAASDECNPPFSYERVGDTLIKKWKPGCLR